MHASVSPSKEGRRELWFSYLLHLKVVVRPRIKEAFKLRSSTSAGISCGDSSCSQPPLVPFVVVDASAHSLLGFSRPACCLSALLQVLLCTGSDARNLDVLPNAKARGIFTLRSLEDHEALGKFLEEALKYNSELRVAIIGASFVGLELASAMKKKGIQHVTVIGQVGLMHSHTYT